MPRTTRDNFFADSNPDVLRNVDAYARGKGFPSSKAMAAVIEVGHKLAVNQTITQADINNIAQHYPAVPKATVTEYVNAVKQYTSPAGRVDALLGLVWSPNPETIHAGRELVENFGVAAVSEAIDAKMADKDGRHDPGPVRPPKHYEDPNALRADVEKMVNYFGGPSKKQVLDSLEPNVRREYLANRLDENVQDRVRAARDPDATLKDSISAAWDSQELTEEAAVEADGAQIEEATKGYA